MKNKDKPSLKVILHQRDHTLVKGYTDVLAVSDLEALLELEPVALPRMLTVRKVDSEETLSVPLASLKALFFVRTFEGHKEYKEVKFFDARPDIEGLWVRLRFFDQESTEGVVRNSLDLLLNPGFFLKPPDQESNNELIYVVKSSLLEFMVLGVKSTY